MDFSMALFDGNTACDSSEMSQTLKYLLENPSLLQPPDTVVSKEKGKDEKSQDFMQSIDPSSAYLGPQLWDDMLLSNDLKLEPVNLDELLDGAAVDGELGDFSLLLENTTNQTPSNQHSPTTDSSDCSSPLLAYQDMPPLLTVCSPEAVQIQGPLSLHQYVEQDKAVTTACSVSTQQSQDVTVLSQHQNVPCQVAKLPDYVSHNQRHLREQQAVLLSDIMTNHQLQHQPQQFNQLQGNLCQTSQSVTLVANPVPGYPAQTSPQQQCPALETFEMPLVSQSSPIIKQQIPIVAENTIPSYHVQLSPQNETMEETFPAKSPSPIASPSKPIEIRIPSPVKMDFVPNQADVLISTPRTDDGEDITFDPSTRCFTTEELKPQPIVRKSRKVFVPSDNKDTKYWNRRNKNNMAAKRSREARRVKENQISMRANFLELENVSLKTEVKQLRDELTRVVELVKRYEKCYPHILQKKNKA